MDLLDRFLGHDAATTRDLLELSRGLTDEQLDRPLGIDHGTLRSSFEHLISGMENWTDLMLGQPIRWRIARNDPSPSIEVLSRRRPNCSEDLAVTAPHRLPARSARE